MLTLSCLIRIRLGYTPFSNDDDEEELLHHEIASLCQSKAIERCFIVCRVSMSNPELSIFHAGSVLSKSTTNAMYLQKRLLGIKYHREQSLKH